ncbi:MAG: hypothetical protein FJZ56_01440 [Chlamydiae bacterium]|nr:hypothetical protein [Chlamydiota bacterium]
MKKIFFLLAISVCTVGCGPQQSVELSTYHADGRAKPKVAFIPVIDSSDSTLPWSLSEEFTDGIEKRFLRHSNLFLLNEQKAITAKKNLNPFIDTDSFVKEIDHSAEFVVFVELSEHRMTAKATESLFNVKNNPSYQLNMSVKVKVLDVRHDQPRTILQELFTENYTIPWQLSSVDYEKTSWGKTAYFISPIGLAHAGLIRKISSQIEDYILLAKTR